MRLTIKVGTFTIIVFWAVSTYVMAGPIPDTGQTKCYDNNQEIPCPQPGESFYGQDANYDINPPSYTKLDANGNDLPDDATEWYMVRDNVTRLIWEVKQDKDGTTDYSNPHDADNIYSWYDSNPETNGGNAGTPGDGTDTEDFISSLNSEYFGGFSDWHIPTIKELSYIMIIRDNNSTFSKGYFPNTVSEYWSSTPVASSGPVGTTQVWQTLDNSLTSHDTSTYIHVRAVRRGQGQQINFTDNGDGTVTDISTGLMWQQATAVEMNWKSAISYCEGLSLAGYDDWRLPNRNELQSLVDYSTRDAAIEINAFPDTVFDPVYFGYWSSTTGKFPIVSPETSWLLDFSFGSLALNSKLYYRHVRAVRGGQPQIDGHIFVSAPRGGKIWGIGREYSITWDRNGTVGNVKISLSRDGGKTAPFETIAATTENDGAFAWTVTGPESPNCVLRVEPLGDPNLGSQAGFFTIKELVPEFFTRPFQVAIVGAGSEQVPLTVWALGGTYDLTSKITSWASSDETVAKVDAGGVVTALKGGKTNIQATYGGVTVTTDLEIVEDYIAETEPNENSSSANPLEEGQVRYGEILNDSDVDTFEIGLPEGQIVRLEMLLNNVGQSAQVKVTDSVNSTLSEFHLNAQGWDRRVLTLPQGVNTVSITANTSVEYLIRYVFLSNLNGGNLLWEYDLGGENLSYPTVSGGRVYFGSSDGKFYCLDSATGGEAWSVEISGSSAANTAVAAVSGGKLYITSPGSMSSLDAASGSLLWQSQTYYGGSPYPAISDGRLFVGFHEGLYSFGAETGFKIWDYDVLCEEAWCGFNSSPVVSDGKVYALSGDGRIFCLDALTGTKLWEQKVGDNISHPPAISEGRVYVAAGFTDSTEHKIYSLDALS